MPRVSSSDVEEWGCLSLSLLSSWKRPFQLLKVQHNVKVGHVHSSRLCYNTEWLSLLYLYHTLAVCRLFSIELGKELEKTQGSTMMMETGHRLDATGNLRSGKIPYRKSYVTKVFETCVCGIWDFIVVVSCVWLKLWNKSVGECIPMSCRPRMNQHSNITEREVRDLNWMRWIRQTDVENLRQMGMTKLLNDI